MRKIQKSINSITISLTAIFAFAVWNTLNFDRYALIDTFNMPPVVFSALGYLTGAVFSCGFFILINKVVYAILNRSPRIKKRLLGSAYFEGKWGGGYFYTDGFRILITTVTQDLDDSNDAKISGNVYSVGGQSLGSMTYRSVRFDCESLDYYSAYTARSRHREYLMNGTVYGKYEVDQDNQPRKVDVYAYQANVPGKQHFINFRLPPEFNNSDDAEILRYMIEDNFENTNESLLIRLQTLLRQQEASQENAPQG